MSYSIMLDAGHGGRDPGAVYEGRQEKDDALRLALAVGERLADRGIDVRYTRTTDVYETPYEKAQEANEAGVDYFISIHRNAFPGDSEVMGAESLVYDKTGLRYGMAQSINDHLETAGFVNLGVRADPGLVVLNKTKMPAVLVEAGFIDSDTDNRLFDANFDDIAQAIAAGILDTLEAADAIGMTETAGMTEAAGITETKGGYTVQAGLFRRMENAERLREELEERGYPAVIDRSGPYIRVRVGDYEDLNEAAAAERRLKQEGYQTLVVS